MNLFADSEFRAAARLSDGRLLVSCQTSNTVLVTDANGKLTGDVIEGNFNKPQGIAVDPKTNKVYIVDRYNNCVKVFDPDGKGFLFDKTIGAGQLQQPVGIAIADQKIYVADNENHRVVAFYLNGNLWEIIGEGPGRAPGQLFCPCGVAVYRDLLIVAEWGNGRVQVFSKDRTPVFVVEGIKHAHAVACDDKGNVYVAQYSDRIVRRFKICHTDDNKEPTFIVPDVHAQLAADAPCGLMIGDDEPVIVATTRLIRLKAADWRSPAFP